MDSFRVCLNTILTCIIMYIERNIRCSNHLFVFSVLQWKYTFQVVTCRLVVGTKQQSSYMNCQGEDSITRVQLNLAKTD